VGCRDDYLDGAKTMISFRADMAMTFSSARGNRRLEGGAGADILWAARQR